MNPYIVPALMGLFSWLSSRQTGHLADQQSQNLAAQNQELLYQRQRREQADPALNALLHISMGMLPTYQQSQPGIFNWGGFGSGGGGGFGSSLQNGNLFELNAPNNPYGGAGLPRGTAQTGPGNTVMMGGYRPSGPMYRPGY